MYGTASCNNLSDTLLRCDANFGSTLVPIRVNLTSMTAYITGTKSDGTTVTAQLPFGYLTKSGYVFKQGDLSTLSQITSLPIGASLIRSNSTYQLLLSDPDFVGSIFERMYYYDGEGLRCFDPFRIGDWPHGGQGAKINAFTTDYSCSSENNVTNYNVIATSYKTSAGIGDRITFDYAAYLNNGTLLSTTQTNVNSTVMPANFSFDKTHSVPQTLVLGSGTFLKPLETLMQGLPLDTPKTFSLPAYELQNSSFNGIANQFPNSTVNFRVKVYSAIATQS
jgi:hypothetical protein